MRTRTLLIKSYPTSLVVGLNVIDIITMIKNLPINDYQEASALEVICGIKFAHTHTQVEWLSRLTKL